MGSLSFDGVRFQIYSNDQSPAHAHAFYGSTLAVVELADADNLGLRSGSVVPTNAKRNDLKKMLDAAAAHYTELIKLWEATHGITRA